VAVALGVAGALTSAASAAPNPCSGDGSNGGTIIVPSGTTCNLQGSTVGSVFVQAGGRLISGSGTHITGSVYSSGAGTDTTSDPFALGAARYNFSIIICNTTIDASINVQGSASNVVIGDDENCGSNKIGGSVNLSNNTGGVEMLNDVGSCPIGGCGIGGSVTVNNNTGVTHDDPESAEIGANKIAGSLACSGNANGVSNDGSPNTVTGARTGQCATL
jgi:hypothetical protein